jgi:hypothetical protein
LARQKAELPDEVTWDACRHGGITELTDAGVTENEGMASSGHASPEAFRRYAKKNETQRVNAALKRRAWIATATPGDDNPERDPKKEAARPDQHAVSDPVRRSAECKDP